MSSLAITMNLQELTHLKNLEAFYAKKLMLFASANIFH